MNLIFDFGGVLIDWDPHHLYDPYFGDRARADWFLQNICTMEWNTQMDGGKPFAEGIAELSARFPEWSKEIEMFHSQWTKMVGGPIPGMLELVRELKAAGHRLYGLSNWSAETFPLICDDYPVLNLLDGMVVSGFESAPRVEGCADGFAAEGTARSAAGGGAGGAADGPADGGADGHADGFAARSGAGGAAEACVSGLSASDVAEGCATAERGATNGAGSGAGARMSGRAPLIKPDPEIYKLLLSRYSLQPADCIFIDDNPANVAAAQTIGIHAIPFTNCPNLRKQLAELNLL